MMRLQKYLLLFFTFFSFFIHSQNTCNLALIRSTLTGAGNIELLGMDNTCSLYFINPQFMTGPDAQAYAQSFGTNLISVQSATENSDLINALSNQGFATNVIWIGYSDAISEGNFVWYDGAALAFTNWALGEPNNAGDEDCTQINPDGSWNDLNCSGYNSMSVIEVNICPQITVINAPIHCPFTNVTLSASTLFGSPGYTYTWVQSGTETFTNTSTAGNTDNISLTSMGANTFTVLSEDRYSCSQSASIILSLNPTPTITVNNSTTTICEGQQTVTLTANGATTYSWIPGTGLSATTGSIVTGTPTVSQNYTVVGMDGNGCFGGTITAITVNPIPTLTISPNMTICPGDATILTAIGATSYTWLPALSLSSVNGNTVSATPTVPTTYTIQGSSLGCIGTETVSVYVSGNGFLPNIYIIQKNSLCDTSLLNWLNITSVTPTLAQGNLPSGLTVNATHSNGGMSTTPSMFSGSSFPATYSVPIAATTIRNDLGGTFNFCFNQPVINPQIAFASIGQGGLPITINTSVPYQVIWTGLNMSYPSTTSLIGSEGFTIIRFPGQHTCVALDYIGDESYCNLAFGVMDADCQGQPICPGDPIELIGNGAISYTWSNGSNTIAIVPTPSTTTNYSVVGENSDGCLNTTTTTVIVHPTPTITVNSSTICMGQQTATLIANGADTYSWIPGTDLSATTGSIVTGNPTSSQNYTVTGTDLNSCIAETTTSITVNSLPTLTVSPDMTVCPLSANTLTVGGAASYTWSPNIYLSTNTSSNVICTPSVTTTYTIDGLSATTCTNSTIMNIVVSNTLIVTASATTPTICPSGSSSLMASGATTYTWSPALTLSSVNGATVTSTPTTSTTYTVIGSTSTCTNSAQVVITLTTTPVISIATNPSVICSGSSSALTANGASTYTWSPGSTLSSTNGPVVNANPNVTFTYNVLGTSDLGCIDSTTVILTVVATPTISTTGNPLTICAGNTSTLSATSGATDYTWSPGGSLSSINTSSTIATPVSTTNYTIIGSNGIVPFVCISTKTIQIVVNSSPTVIVSPSVPICEGQPATIYATGGTTYSWSPAADVDNPFNSSTIANPTATTIYTVTATANNCSSTATVQVLVNQLPILDAGRDTTINIDNIITLSGSGINVEYIGFLSPDGTPLNCNYCTTITINPQNNTCYTLEGISSFGCRNTDEICVTVTKDWDIFIPNAFTPNGDLKNELFIPMGYGISEIRLIIFDRWGHEIFESKEDIIGWDGKNNELICDDGIYTYKVDIKTMSGKKISKTGHLMLLPRTK